MDKKENNFGIVGIEYCLPSGYVDQVELASYFGIEKGKLLKGLGLLQMGVISDREDVISMAMNAVYRLMNKYKIGKNDVGRLEVGTESNHDGSKSIKTYLMDLFEGNNNICGCDTTNACYGGTNALLNGICWLESSLWNGKYAIVVTTDVSSYKEEAAIPTSGAGAVAMLLGPNPVFKIRKDSLSYFFANTFDFMKPKDLFPFPVYNGKLSIEWYMNAFKSCYESLKEKDFDYTCFHSPYARLPEKIADMNGIPHSKLEPSLLCSRRNGNSYTSSLYLSFVSLLFKIGNGKLGEKILMFSLGSGCASSLFILERMREENIITDLEDRLDLRRRVDPREYMKNLKKPIFLKNYEPEDLISFEGFYLEKIEDYRRIYKFSMKD